MPEGPDRDFLLGIFLMEAWDTLATLEDGLVALRAAEPPGLQTLEPLVVVSHRLKGAAALHGFPGLSEVAGALEQLLEGLPAEPPTERSAAADFLVDLVGLLKNVFDGIAGSGQENAEDIAAFKGRHAALFKGSGDVSSAPAAGSAGPLRAELQRYFAESADILAYFGPEATEHLEAMTKSLLVLEQRGPDEAEVATLFRAVHTLKGAAYTVGFTTVGDLAHRIEDLLMAVREERLGLTPEAIEAVFSGVDALRLLLGAAGSGEADLDGALERALRELDRVLPATESVEAAVAPAVADPAVAAPMLARLPAAEAPPVPSTPGAGPVIRVNLDRLDALMNLVGELVIARSRLDGRLRELDRVGQLLLFSRTRMGKAVRDFESRHQAGGPAKPRASEDATSGGAPRTAGPQPLRRPEARWDTPAGGDGFQPLSQLFAELEFDRYDDFDVLARSVTELSADLAEVQTQLAGLIRTVWEDTAHIQRLTGGLRAEITRARMVPVGKLFARFARQVREAAKAAGRAVVLAVSGESVEVDNTVIEQIADPLLHLVQNAIAHGIESEAERRERGKPTHGTVYLSAYQRGGFVYIEVEDDGRGIDPAALATEAVRQGFLRAEDAPRLSEREALHLIFLPGFSTAPVVTTAAGRGVGMDVVRTNVTRLNGEIDVATELGAGTRFTLKLPLTLVISDALLVRSGGQPLALPLNAVRVILHVRPEEIRVLGRSEMVRVDDELVELFRLDRVLGRGAAERGGPLPVVVVRAAGKSIALVVDELGGKEEIVIKSLGAFLEGVGPFTSATITGEGRVILVLDPGRLIQLTESAGRDAVGPRSGGETPRVRSAGDAAPRVLLVDDSVSVRKFVGHMLERAGFQVLTANDGAEALHQLTEAVVDVVVTDLEMPRVNGYELIEDLRRRAATRDLPIVVLTTRAGEKHASLARRLGVRHYVSKPVDEQAFVRLIESLATAAAPALSGARQ